jgi:hypothetical protein
MDIKLIILWKENCLIHHMSENVDLMDIQQLVTTCQLDVLRALVVRSPVGVLRNGNPIFATDTKTKNFSVEFVECKRNYFIPTSIKTKRAQYI